MLAAAKTKYLEMLNDHALQDMSIVKNRYQDILIFLQNTPKTPEDLLDYDRKLKDFNSELVTLEKRLELIIQKYRTLEDLSYEVAEEESDEVWEMTIMPSVIREAVVNYVSQLESSKAKMSKELTKAQTTLTENLFALAEDAAVLSNYSDINMALSLEERVQTIHERFQELESKAKTYARHEQILGVEPVDRSSLEEFKQDFEPIYTLWKTAANWQISVEEWFKSSFISLNAEKMSNFVFEAHRNIAKILRQVRYDSHFCIHSNMCPSHKTGPLGVATEMKRVIENMKSSIPLIVKLRHPGVRTRHWNMIFKEMGIESTQNDAQFTLLYVLDLHLDKYQDTVVNVTDYARNEHTLESALDKMYNDLKTYSIPIALYKSTGTYVIYGTEPLSVLLEDQLITLQTMFSSVYIDNFLERAIQWKEKLLQIQKILGKLLIVKFSVNVKIFGWSVNIIGCTSPLFSHLQTFKKSCQQKQRNIVG